MPVINYYDGKRIVPVSVSDEVAEYYREAKREEWRMEKQIKRHEVQISFAQMENQDGYLLTNKLSASDPLNIILERDEQIRREIKLKAALAALTPNQLKLVRLLRRGKSIAEISGYFGIEKSAVSHMRKRICESLAKFLL